MLDERYVDVFVLFCPTKRDEFGNPEHVRTIGVLLNQPRRGLPPDKYPSAVVRVLTDKQLISLNDVSPLLFFKRFCSICGSGLNPDCCPKCGVWFKTNHLFAAPGFDLPQIVRSWLYIKG